MSIYEKKRLSQIFFQKNCSKIEKNSYFSEVNILEKIEKKIFQV